MYFVIIMAFALVLSDNMPPKACNLFRDLPVEEGTSLWATLMIVVGQLLLVHLVAVICRRKTLSKLDGTDEGHDAAADTYALAQQIFLFLLAGLLVLTIVFTPWPTLLRDGWRLGSIPLICELVILLPFFLSLIIMWTSLYPAELALKTESLSHADQEATDKEIQKKRASTHEALLAATRPDQMTSNRLSDHLIDKIRHQVLILAVPMGIIVFAKNIIHNYADKVVTLPRDPIAQGLILNTALGTVSIIVLALAPLMLRYIWATEPLPEGPLRDRFIATCGRINLKYREILLWHTHKMAVNAAVMGFIAPLRYILVSDALLETMDEEEIEAVFGHEAGHVNHWHLPYFGVFAIVSMYAAGGAMHLLVFLDRRFLNIGIEDSFLQLVALIVLLAMWLFGFSWLSRKFERQADLFGVRCITPDIQACEVTWCPVHGDQKKGGLCVTAANLFGKTLGRIADLNGIPADAPSWRHGTIDSRRKLIETFCSDSAKLSEFDRMVLRIKLGLIAIAVIGSIIAVWIYYAPFARLMGW